MVWLYWTASATLVGAQVNSETIYLEKLNGKRFGGA
jgi:uncharacterized BrkB/YihY/UPF0761 family membrane protein